MFEHITIAAPATCAGATSLDMSPRDTPYPSPPTRFSPDIKQRAPSTCTALASQLDDLKPEKDDISSSYLCSSSISLDASTKETFLPLDLAIDPKYENELVVDPSEDDTTFSPNSSPSLSTLRLCRRLQRQLNSQLLCTHSQIRAISEIVEEMVSTKSQYNIATSSITSQSTSSPSHISMPEIFEAHGNNLQENVDDDEGYCEGGVENDEEIDPENFLMNFRRASAPLGIRRREYTTGVVFSRPRMRRKIMRRKRPENLAGNRAETGT